AIALSRLREQAHPEASRSQVGDLTVLGDVALVMRVACERQGGIGKRKDITAVAQTVPIDHVHVDAHGENSEARSHLFNLHSHGAASLIISLHSVCTRLGHRGDVARHALLPVNLGARFSRKARMPSAASGEAAAFRCRSRSTSSCWASVLVEESAMARLVRPRA